MATVQATSFNLTDVMLDLKTGNKTSKYLEVKWRLLWFREVCESGTIETKLLTHDINAEFEEEVDLKVWNPNVKGYDGKQGKWTTVWDDEAHAYKKTTKKAKGYSVFQATICDGKGNSATGTKMECALHFPDYLEKSETGAIGRGLAALGYGTQFVGNDFDENHRIVDAPIIPIADPDAPASPEQLRFLDNLKTLLPYKKLRKAKNAGDANELIAYLIKDLQRIELTQESSTEGL